MVDYEIWGPRDEWFCLGTFGLNTLQNISIPPSLAEGKEGKKLSVSNVCDTRSQILDNLHLVTAFLWAASSIGQRQHQSLIKRRFCQASQTGNLWRGEGSNSMYPLE